MANSKVENFRKFMTVKDPTVRNADTPHMTGKELHR